MNPINYDVCTHHLDVDNIEYKPKIRKRNRNNTTNTKILI